MNHTLEDTKRSKQLHPLHLPSRVEVLQREAVKISGSGECYVPLSVLEHAVKGDFEERDGHALRLRGKEGRWGKRYGGGRG